MSAEGNFDVAKFFGWKSDNKLRSKNSKSHESSLVHELEDLDENIAALPTNGRTNNQVKNLVSKTDEDDKPSPPVKQPDQPKPNQRVIPPRRPPPPVADEDEVVEDQPQPQPQPVVADRVPKELHGLIRNTNNSPPGNDRSRQSLKPTIRYQSKSDVDVNRATTLGSLKTRLKGAYQSTKDSIISIPKYVEKASDAISLTMKLDKKGRILAMIEQLNKSMSVVRNEFSKFTETWSPIMEGALNYVGATNLNKLKWNDNDEFDFRRDALNVIAAGFEFMRIMIAWRQNTLISHAAYRLYLETVKKDIGDPAVVIDENFMHQMDAIHNYILFKSWLLMDNINLEPKMKFEYISQKHDALLKNYESDYFRSLIIFQELYEPTMQEFDSERQQVIDTVSTAAAYVDQFAEVDDFIEDFIKSLDQEPIQDIELTPEMIKFMADLKPEIQYNPQVYDKKFMLKLKEAKEKAIKELQDQQEDHKQN